MLALIVDGQLSRYPYSFGEMRRDNPRVSFSAEPGIETLAPFGVVRVSETPRPDPGPDESVTEGRPERVDGTWRQTWVVTQASPEAVAARQRAETEAVDKAEIKADTFVAAFLDMSPAQLAAYVDNNTGTLAQTRVLLRKMAAMLLVLARRNLR